jgi:hypothetical protein
VENFFESKNLGIKKYFLAANRRADRREVKAENKKAADLFNGL